MCIQENCWIHDVLRMTGNRIKKKEMESLEFWQMDMVLLSN